MTYWGHPKNNPKSELPLSEGPELDRWCACHPDGRLEPVQPVVTVAADLSIIREASTALRTLIVGVSLGLLVGYGALFAFSVIP